MKTEVGLGFQQLPRELTNFNALKTRFGCYCCINSFTMLQNNEKVWALFFGLADSYTHYAFL